MQEEVHGFHTVQACSTKEDYSQAFIQFKRTRADMNPHGCSSDVPIPKKVSCKTSRKFGALVTVLSGGVH